MSGLFDARAWVVWLASAATLTLLTRNPLYVLILLLAAQAVRSLCRSNADAVQLSLWRMGALIIGFSMLFNALFVHIGQTVLLTLPINWPLVGGNVTLEALVYGAISGLILLTLLAQFLAFMAAVAVGDMVRLTPRAFHHLGLVALIAITYVPETLRQLQRIREAQAVRGHRLQGLTSWRPIVIPLLIGGMERSLNLAEAMVARGFGATEDVGTDVRSQVLLVMALLGVIGGWLLAIWRGWPGWLLLATGVALLLLLVWWQGRVQRTTRYRVARWMPWDWLVVITAVLPLFLAVFGLPGISGGTLAYEPYPALMLPPFDPVLGLALLLLATPALITAVIAPAPRAKLEFEDRV